MLPDQKITTELSEKLFGSELPPLEAFQRTEAAAAQPLALQNRIAPPDFRDTSAAKLYEFDNDETDDDVVITMVRQRPTKEQSHDRSQKSVEAATTNEELEKRMTIGCHGAVRIPPFYDPILKDHQIKGIKFLWNRIVEVRTGCILAHTMGLGKSIQTITFIVTLFRECIKQPPNRSIPQYLKTRRVLILAPVTTLANWVAEFDKWVPQEMQGLMGHIYNFHDAIAGHPSISRKIFFLEQWYNDGGVMLMSYEQFRSLLTYSKNDNHAVKIATYMVNPGPSLLVADEGHRIKNIGSQVTQAIQKINTRARICLTGYPIQNNLREFYCIVNFVAEGLLPPKEKFDLVYAKPIQNIYADSSPSAKFIAKASLLELQLLTDFAVQRIGPEVLRESLPAKTEYYVYCRLTQLQYETYIRLLRDLPKFNMVSPLTFLPLFRAVCNHPILLHKMAVARREFDKAKRLRLPENREGYDVFCEVEVEAEEEIAGLGDDKFLQWTDYFFSRRPGADSYQNSSKMLLTMAIAKATRSRNEKLLIISHSIACLDYLENLLPMLGINVVRLDGNTPYEQRQPLIDLFHRHEDKHTMLLSAKAGSLGINITCANRVILFDSDWNPCHDEQGIGRVYRFGQEKNVYVYRLITYSTLEQRLMAQSVHKRGIASRVIDNYYMPLQDKYEMRKYFAVPAQKPKTRLHDHEISITDDVMRDIILGEGKLSIVDLELGDTIDKAVVVEDSDLLPDRDMERIRQEVKKFRRSWIMNRSIHQAPSQRNM